MFRGSKARGATPRLSHEEVVACFVDYHFGRLSPEMNRAVEQHVRGCARCKREGLQRAAMERQVAARKLKGVRGGKPPISQRGRRLIFILLTLVLAQIIAYQLVNGRAGAFLSLLAQGRLGAAQPNLSQPAPIALSTNQKYPLATAGAASLALSADGKLLAVAQPATQGERPTVTIWSAASMTRLAALPWPGANASAVPSSLAWSSDDSRLAGEDGAQIVIWAMSGGGSSGSVLWQLQTPAAPAMRVYDVTQQAIVQQPDPATAFGHGPLVWGPDGSVGAAPAGAAGTSGVTGPQTPVISPWSTAGAHIFGGASGSAPAGDALIGSSDSDTQRGASMLNWSPDGRYLLWGALSLPVTSAAHGGSAGQAPDSLAAQVAAQVGQAGGKADALLWFAPDGTRVVACSRAGGPQTKTPAQVYDVATGDLIATLSDTCAGLGVHSAVWDGAGKLFTIIPPSGPIETYTMPN